MFAKFKNYDAHMKAIDGVFKQSSFGGALTVIATVVLVLLLQMEVSSYFQKDVINHMKIDQQSTVQSIRLSFDIEFLRMPCDQITFYQEATRGSVHTEDFEHIQKDAVNYEGKTGCRIVGYSITDRVGGHFKFGKNIQPNDIVMADNTLISPPDLTHRINHIMFLPHNSKVAHEDDIPGTDNLLNGRYKEGAEGTGIHQYGMQVVRTEYTKSGGEKLKANQYSVTERDIDVIRSLQGVVVGGQMIKEFFGLVFVYDFYPIQLNLVEEKESFMTFLGTLCGILGGVFTIFALIERFLQGSTKMILGKED